MDGSVTSTPLVTVVICAYNPGEFLRESLDSILNQTHKNLEVLLIDDGSTDGSVDRLSDITDPRLRIIRQPNSGKAVAMNRALAEMRGEFYAIQDADDISYPTRIERQVACMHGNPDVAVVFCGHDLILNDRRVAPRFRSKTAEQCKSDIDRFLMPAHDPTAMHRVSMVRPIEYETELRIGQGYDHLLRIGERYAMLVLGECLYSYRVHGQSVTRADHRRREAFVQMVIERAYRRRGMEIPTAKSNGRRAGYIARDNNMAAHFIESALDLCRARKQLAAISVGLSCAKLHPQDPRYYKALFYAVAPRQVVQFLRNRRSR